VPSLNVFVTPTGFIVDVSGAQPSITRVYRVVHQGVNMNRLAQVNALSREAAAGRLDETQIASRLRQIAEQAALYPTWLVVIGVAMACGAFGMLLGGGWREFLATLMGATLAMLVRIALRPVRLVPLLVTVAAAFGATVASWFGCHVLACPVPNLAPIASVLQLVPGVPLVTAVIDLATGDVLSGVARGAYAALMAAGIALGMLLFLAWGVR
jgi:uncharacterized membrane protein YjjP (DUF1212 family)